MGFSEEQIKSLAPAPAAFNSGKKLSSSGSWESFNESERVIWGEIKGSGKKPYLVQVDTQDIAYKCTCPSRQFPCKHAIALMLLHSKSKFAADAEPEWVTSWLENRSARKAKQQEPSKEKSEEDIQASAVLKKETEIKRLELVKAGAAELELWLKDLVRIGLLELPNKSSEEFRKVAARMVDAKAPGLAGWVRSLNQLDYSDQNQWHDQALGIISRLFLLLQAIKKYDTFDELMQTTIRNLAGWSQSGKELLADANAETIKDEWLVAGQLEEQNEDITTQRNWLVGKRSNRKALILNFSTRFSQFETSILPGTLIEAELAFFPSILPVRAVIKAQRSVSQETSEDFQFADDWMQVHYHALENLKVNPWANDQIILLRNARLIEQNRKWLIKDSQNRQAAIVRSFDSEKCLKWLSMSGNKHTDMACVLRDNEVIPLGIFFNQHYHLL